MTRQMRVRINGQWYNVELGDVYQSPVEVEVDGDLYLVELESATSSTTPANIRSRQPTKGEPPGLKGVTQNNDNLVRCPLPGKIVSITAFKGQNIEQGDEICVLESMKMEQSVRMGTSGVVKSVKIKKNQNVDAGTPLLELH